jgi:hypothetical protein
LGRDQDPRRGFIAGNVVIGKAADESDLKEYRLYWATDPSTKIGAAIVSLTKTGGDLTYELDASVPNGAGHLIALSANDDGELLPGATTPAVDNFPIFVDISAGEDGGAGSSPSAVVDDVNGKLLVAIATARTGRLGLMRCNLDGTGCTYKDIGGAPGGTSAQYPSAVLDKARGKLFVAADQFAEDDYLGFYSSNLDGTGSKAYYPPGPEIRGSAAALDTANGKVIVASLNVDNSLRLRLERCDTSTGSCSATDVWPDLRGLDRPAWNPSVAIDELNGKVLVVTGDDISMGRTRLARCNLDGTSCTFQFIASGFSFGPNPRAPVATVIDAVARKLIVVGPSIAGIPESTVGRLGLARCDLDNDGGCSAPVDISAGQPDYSGMSPTAVIDTTNGKLLVVAISQDHGATMGLFRCNLDGTACTHTDLSVGHENIADPSAVIDKTNGRLLVAATYPGFKLGLFSIGLW